MPQISIGPDWKFSIGLIGFLLIMGPIGTYIFSFVSIWSSVIGGILVSLNLFILLFTMLRCPGYPDLTDPEEIEDKHRVTH